jgi:uncharacterized repeat protein (TIGR03803 family)
MTTIKNYRMSALALLALIVVPAAIPAYAQFSVLYDFGTRSGDPLSPSGGLVQGRDGNLYGISQSGGTTGSAGTVFKVSPAGTMRVVYSFCSQTNCADGATPLAGLTLRPDSHFIGTTSSGGDTANDGTIFDLTQTGDLTVLYTFTGGKDGRTPSAPPILGPDGSFYGTTTFGGGSSSCGTIYRITNSGTSSGGFKLLHDFDKTDGCNPKAALVLGTDGNFYGATSNGGTCAANGGCGVVFQVTPAGKVTVLHNFAGGTDGYGSLAPLIQGSDGNFYGTTQEVFAGQRFPGNVFQITPTGTYTILHALNGTTDGAQPATGLVQATDGNFYGAAAIGGNSTNGNCSSDGGCGTLFQVTAGGSYSVLYNFDFTTGFLPFYALVQHTNGVLFGVARGGSVNGGLCGDVGCGVVYSWSAGLPAFVSTVPFMGKVGSFVEILGQGFTSATTVSFNGTPATATVVSGTYLRTTVPAGATTGPVTVTTSGGTLTSNRQFVVTP